MCESGLLSKTRLEHPETVMQSNEQDLDAPLDGPPPFLERWPRVYLAVLAYLLALIIGLYVVSRMFSY